MHWLSHLLGVATPFLTAGPMLLCWVAPRKPRKAGRRRVLAVLVIKPRQAGPRAPTWPLTGNEHYPADSPPGHLRNALGVLRARHMLFSSAPPELDQIYLAAERRLELAIEGLDQMSKVSTEPR